MNENRSQLLDIIEQSSFAVDDVLLFLDTHPCDQTALAYYQTVDRMRSEAMDAYQQGVGPLMSDRVSTANGYWTWVQGPWPWEGGR